MTMMICEGAKECDNDRCVRQKQHEKSEFCCVVHCSNTIGIHGSKCTPVKEEVVDKKIKSVRTKVPLPDVKIGTKGRQEQNTDSFSFEMTTNNGNRYYYSRETTLRNPEVFEVEFEEEKKKRPMNQREFIDFCMKHSPEIRNKNGRWQLIWEPFWMHGYSAVADKEYRLSDGTIGKFEVEE